MYTAKYNVEVKKDINGNKSVVTILKAKFRFGDEVAKKDNSKIAERIECDFDGLLKEYLIEKEKLEYKGIMPFISDYIFAQDSKKIKINDFPFFTLDTLSLNLKATAVGHWKLEEIINLDRLNDFILTGKRD